MEYLLLAAQNGVGGFCELQHGVFALGEREIPRGDEALDRALDLGERLLLHDAVGRQFVEVQRAHALLGRAFEHLRCQRHAVASSHAVDAREDFLRIKRHVAPFEVALAAAAALARGGGGSFAEVAQDEGAQAFGRVAVVGHLLQAAEFVCFARGILGRDVDQILLRHDVLRRKEQNALARLSVASGAACLLVV